MQSAPRLVKQLMDSGRSVPPEEGRDDPGMTVLGQAEGQPLHEIAPFVPHGVISGSLDGLLRSRCLFGSARVLVHVLPFVASDACTHVGAHGAPRRIGLYLRCLSLGRLRRKGDRQVVGFDISAPLRWHQC